MQKDDTEHILTQHGIRPTACRIIVCRFLANASAPLTVSEIETALDTIDRSTITRTMAAFSEAKLLHRIDDGSGSVKYELCRDSSHQCEHEHADLHPHFYCRVCHHTICLTDTHIPAVPLPDGCVAEDVNYVVTGVCPRCRQKAIGT